jgi:Ca2+-binding RTX toxin-like protein
MLRKLLLPTMLLLTVAPTAADASTITRQTAVQEDPRNGPSSYDTVTLEAAPGETNQVTVTLDAGYAYITDASAPITSGACEAVTPNQRRCTLSQLQYVILSLGDGNDSAIAPKSTLVFRLRGGDGDDTLTTGGVGLDNARGDAGDDVLIGSDLTDNLDGGPGRDRISAGGGDDVLDGDGDGDSLIDQDEGIADDVLDGGPGIDAVTYDGRLSAPVTVDLEAGTGGQSGETDTLTGIESAQGGRGADTLLGDSGPNVLGPTAGTSALPDGGDTIDGRGGNDALTGTEGRDTLIGAAGDDVLDGRNGDDNLDGGLGNDRLVIDGIFTGAPGSDTAACGAGSDVLGSPLPRTLLPRDCERVGVEEAADVSVRRTGSNRLILRARRASRDEDVCAVRVVVREAKGKKRMLASGTLRARFKYGVDYRKTLTLTRTGKQALARRNGNAIVKAVADPDCSGGLLQSRSYTLPLS